MRAILIPDTVARPIQEVNLDEPLIPGSINEIIGSSSASFAEVWVERIYRPHFADLLGPVCLFVDEEGGPDYKCLSINRRAMFLTPGERVFGHALLCGELYEPEEGCSINVDLPSTITVESLTALIGEHAI